MQYNVNCGRLGQGKGAKASVICNNRNNRKVVEVEVLKGKVISKVRSARKRKCRFAKKVMARSNDEQESVTELWLTVLYGEDKPASRPEP